MIKPEHNKQAASIISTVFMMPSLRFLRRSLKARYCYALIQGDRYLALADKEKL